LGPADIAQPICTVLSGQENAFVMMGEVTGIDLAQGSANVGESRLSYDSLILAAGATDNYFGHPEWQRCGVPR
jgi:NADH dehydrogenase